MENLNKKNLPGQGNFLQTKKFFLANKDQKGSLKAKILDPLNTKYYAKILLTL